MDDREKHRWTEIQFHYICHDVMDINNNMMDVMDLIDNLSLLGRYPSEHVKGLAQEFLASHRMRPSKEELIVLMHDNGVPVSEIRRRQNTNNKIIYKILEQHSKDPMYIYPRLRLEQTQAIEAFVKTFNKLKSIGL